MGGAYSSRLSYTSPSTMGWSAYPSDAGGTGPASGEDERLRLSDVGKLARRTRRRIVGAARADDQVTFGKLFREHLGVDPQAISVVQETWPSYDHVNVQAGLDAWLSEPGRTHDVVGVLNYRHRDLGLSELMRTGQERHPYGMGVAPGNVSRTNLPSGPDGEVRPCVECAVYLVTDGDQRLAMLFRKGDSHTGRPSTSLEIGSLSAERASEVGSAVRQLAVERNVYRGHVVSFDHDMFGERDTVLKFHPRPLMTLDELILPEETVAAVSRQVVGVARHRAQLLASGQHLKRGLLLYGPPGVGKTHTVRYLTSELTDVTIVLLSGSSLSGIGAACSVARTLQPAMIVVEDVDLIAEERTMYGGEHPLLFQLLNEMDGLAEDSDVVFLLTTNRPDVLEPALAQRPGRVDQAVELHLPDEEGRRRLFALYSKEMIIDESRLDSVLARTQGVTASFLKELLRRAAVLSAESAESGETSGPLSVSADHLDAALDDLLQTQNAMTRVLLGAAAPEAAVPQSTRSRRSHGARFVGEAVPGLAPDTD